MNKQCKRDSRSKLLALVLSVLLLLGMLPTTGALAEQKGELTVLLTNDTVKNLPKEPSVEVALYQIGVANPTSKAGWDIDQAFAGYKILEAKTSKELGDIATQLGGDIVGKNQFTATKKTLSGGSTKFSNLEDGVYFGMMTQGPAGLVVTPFIVTVPSRDPETKELRYSYPVVLKESCVTSATVKKVWTDADNQDGKRPDHIDVTLSNGQKVTLNDKNDWTDTIDNLPIYKDGVEITYTWTEALVDGYTSTQVTDGLITTLTNRHTPEITEVTVKKVWDDANNQDGKRPDHIDVTLSDDAKTTVTLNDENEWTAKVSNLPKYKDGKEIVYTWTEALVDGYTSTQVIDGQITTLTNQHTPETTEATVKKVWQDDNNKDKRRPAYIQVTLSNGETVTLNELNGWTVTVPNLPKYKDGQEIKYTWTEAKVDGYTSTQVTEGTITTLTNVIVNTPEPTPTTSVEPTPTVTVPVETTTPPPPPGGPTPTPSTQVSGTKVWVDEGNVHKVRPDSITVKLLADGSDTGRTPTWQNTGSDHWTYTFANLPEVNASGATIHYTVEEVPVENYRSSVSGTTITNELIPKEPKEYRNISGVKTWEDNNNTGGTRPASVTVHLLRDGVEIDKRVITGATGWAYDFGRHPVDDGYGNIYNYTIREDGVPGYFSRVNGMDLINQLLVPPGRPGVPGQPTGNIIPKRNTTTPQPHFEGMTEEEMEEYLDMLDYGTPLWGQLLGTGDETPVYPYVFGGVGVVAILALVLFGRKKKGKKAD